MKRISPGEWRYAVLIILLLMIATRAAVYTTNYVQELIVSLQSRAAARRLLYWMEDERRHLGDLVAAVAVVAGGQAAAVDRICAPEFLEKEELDAAAVLDGDGHVLLFRGSDEARGMLPEVWRAWRSGGTADGRHGMFVKAGEHLAAAACAELAAARGGREALVVLLRVLGPRYIQKVRKRMPYFTGLTLDTEKVPSADELLIPLTDPQGMVLAYAQVGYNADEIQPMVREVTLTFNVLIIGLILLTGAMGLWAVRSTTYAESLRRVGRFVDSMDYLSDGLVALDKHRRVTGCNPAGRQMAPGEYEKGRDLRSLFPMLGEADVTFLLDADRPREIEKVRGDTGVLRVWRFRSQPSEDMDLILVSDVTDEKTVELRRRQMAALQVVGRIARGVAHDFNNILCAISGHAELIKATGMEKPEDRASLEAIIREAERGAELSLHLLSLSRSRESEAPCDRVEEHVQRAADLLKVGVPPLWDMEVECGRGLPAVPLGCAQVEEAVVNLGLVLIDEFGRPGRLRLNVQSGPEGGVQIFITATEAETAAPLGAAETTIQTSTEDVGVIQSVVRTMIEEVGGTLEILRRRGAVRAYRVNLPEFKISGESASRALPGEEASALIKERHVLLAMPADEYRGSLSAQLEKAGAEVTAADDVVAALGQVDSDSPLEGIVFDRGFLGSDPAGLLRAIIKLRPGSGIVVLGAENSELTAEPGVISLAAGADAMEVLESIVRARRAAVNRPSAEATQT